MKIFISTTTFARYSKEPLVILKKNRVAFSLNTLKRRLSEREISGFLNKGAYAGLIAGTEPITRAVLNTAKSLKVISRAGTGMDNIDLPEARRLNIKVYNTPDVLVDSVAELSIGLILDALRKITLMDRNIRANSWSKEMGLLFKGKTLGIAGFGRIGRRVAELAGAFGARVIFYDPERIKTGVARQVHFAGLIKEAEIISIHASGKKVLFSGNEISKMKDGVILVNTSRGSAIDEKALYDGLRSGKISFACLDVFSNEPYSGKLLGLGNCVLTPHIGSYAKEARIRMEVEAVNNLIKGLRGLKRTSR